MQTNPTLTVAEAVITGLLQEIGPKNFAIALHNASVHGDVFKDNFDEFLDDDDSFLKVWYTGVDVLYESAK